MGYTRGTLGKGGAGRIRGPIVDEKTKVRISKTLQRNLQRQQAYGGTTTVKRQVSGTASSVAFTPLQVRRLACPTILNHSSVCCLGFGNRQSASCREENQRGQRPLFLKSRNFLQRRVNTYARRQYLQGLIHFLEYS